MAIGQAIVQLGLVNEDFQKGLNEASNKVKTWLNNTKNLMLSFGLINYLWSGAETYTQNAVTQAQAEMSALAEGLTQVQVDNIKQLAEAFELVGVEMETAQTSLTQFILTGKSTQLNSLGVYLSDTTKELLEGMDAAERYQWVLENMPDKIDAIGEALGEETLNMLALQKATDDTKEALGSAFLTVLNSLITTFGGLGNTLKIALAAFSAYKIAVILGNTAIAMSKALAQGGIFVWPAVIASGLAALAAIGSIIGADIIAGNAIDTALSSSASDTTASTTATTEGTTSEVVIVTNDRWGQTQEVLSERSGGNSTNVQTKY